MLSLMRGMSLCSRGGCGGPLAPVARTLHSKSTSQQKFGKFYKEVTTKEVVEDSSKQGWFTVLLDNRQLKTPQRAPFEVPSQELAELVALEWDTQEKELFPELMYVTSLCNAAIDNKTGLSREERVQNLVPFAQTDTLCFRNDIGSDLHELQKEEWDPLVQWFSKRYNTDVMTTTTLFEAQHDAFVDVVDKELHKMNEFTLSACELAIDTAKSVIVSFALLEGEIDAEEAAKKARLETEFQVERFGEVEWAHTMEKYDTQARLAAAAIVMKLSKYYQE
eukprot:m.11738 g.11738  ORF g.11738 m.11738 type:complete len:278 (+) comp7034_c0_seq3:57-890(+)